jgi:hypothetical protein
MAIGATSYEVFEAQRTAACYGRLALPSERADADRSVDRLREVFTNAMLLGAPFADGARQRLWRGYMGSEMLAYRHLAP